MKEKYIFIDKCVFFPGEGILVVGDLHLGYEAMMKSGGVNIPLNQVRECISQLEDVFVDLKKRKFVLKKIVLLGDVKHAFRFEKPEIFDVREVLNFLSDKVGRENVILIKGNHDTFSLSGFELRDYFTEGDIAFFHGHKEFVELYGGGANYLVMGHAHPSVTLRDSAGVKKEKFKCYLTGKWKKKEIIVLPSFLDINYGTDVDEYDDFGVVPSKIFKTFDVHVISDSGEVFRFGKVGDL